MRKVFLKDLSKKEYERLCKRPAIDFEATFKVVREILQDVGKNGDKAVRRYEEKFDGVKISNFQVSKEEIETAWKVAPEYIKKSLQAAAANIERFHRAQVTDDEVVKKDGVTCFRERRPIEKVGLYIPGGSAPLPSTVLMLGIPAKVAGCSEILLCTPPNKSGNISEVILAAAKICGIEKIFKVGGAQAIAAMAFGTKSIPKVSKIFGPGNQYVTAAKMLVSIDPEGSAIDMLAGPSEVLVIADAAARPDFVAADLLSQAEHGPDSQAILVCMSEVAAEEVEIEIKKQLEALSRSEIAKKSLGNSFILITNSIEEALQFSNSYAPEHLLLNVENPKQYVSKIINAGSVFLGAYSCESAGDYASGPNHTLPTYGYAKMYSGLSVDSFTKHITFQEVSSKGALLLCPTVTALAACEGLDAHKRAMEIRVE